MVWTEQEEIILFPQEEPQQPQWGYLDPYHLHQWRKSRHPGIVQRLGSGMCPILAPLSDLPLLPHMAHPPLKPLCWPGKVSENLPAHGPFGLGGPACIFMLASPTHKSVQKAQLDCTLTRFGLILNYKINSLVLYKLI